MKYVKQISLSLFFLISCTEKNSNICNPNEKSFLITPLVLSQWEENKNSYPIHALNMDGEIIKIFEELNDPAGGMCFKFASKFIDGRILEDHHELHQKRRKSHLVEAREEGARHAAEMMGLNP